MNWVKDTIKSILSEINIRFYQRIIIRLANLVTITNALPFSNLKIILLKMTGVKISTPCFIDEGFNCIIPSNIEIDKFCSFGHNNKMWAFSKIQIGPYVQTAMGVTLISGSHHVSDYAPFLDGLEIIIEGENWIGSNVTILGGVTIGRGSIIAAGSVVVKSIPPYTIAGGVPAKVLKARIPSENVISPFGKYQPNYFKDKL
jgi:acetyltransferase-like isoleucine patch superfamily enzyme